MKEKIVLAPQKGPQEMFLATSADICIYGGAAGGGKTFGLLLEPLRYMNNPDYNATIFRRDYTQVTSPGGLWDSSRKIYRYVKGSQPLKTPKLHWTFKRGASVNFAHLGRDEDCDDWQGSQLTMIGFDELTHFSEYQFFYMLSRNRTDSGVKPYVRATCNPDADSWVAEFISWWINQETGYPIPERSGVIRWMVRLNEVVTWFDSREEAVQGAIENGVKPEQAETMPKSVTFIASTLHDNKILMKNDPGYLANLQAMALVQRERLLHGNAQKEDIEAAEKKMEGLSVLHKLLCMVSAMVADADLVEWNYTYNTVRGKRVKAFYGILEQYGFQFPNDEEKSVAEGTSDLYVKKEC